MPFLSPAKLLVILVVAMVVLGPEKLPKVAKQVGGLLSDFRKFRQKLESDVRGSFPDLPSTNEIARAVRSPLSFLDNLADTHDSENGTTSGGSPGYEPLGASGDAVQPSSDLNRPAGEVAATENVPEIPGASVAGPVGAVHQVRASATAVPDDPSMN